MSVQIIEGDCLATLRTLPAESVQCCVTSPPYWNLRDYGHDGQIGLEDTPIKYVAKLVNVFVEVKRVLKTNGCLWLNIGDSYGKAKQLQGVPWRLAFALQDSGWTLRSDVIWHKPNAMPDAATDRPTSAHEHVFLLTKNERYFYDSDAIAEATEGRELFGNSRKKGHCEQRQDNTRRDMTPNFTRNSRNVWSIAPQTYNGAHFATMPPELAERCIKAGSKPSDTVIDPFGGAGTTGLVADRLGRNAILCELNPTYAALARTRIQGDAGLFASVI